MGGIGKEERGGKERKEWEELVRKGRVGGNEGVGGTGKKRKW